MRIVVQRVSRAAVSVDGETIASTGRGLLLLVGVASGDAERDLLAAAEKIALLRIFPGPDGAKMNLSVEDVRGEVLVVSQFTLAGSLKRGRRPSFDGAAAPEIARGLCEGFAAALRARGLRVSEGRFGAMMEVELVNDGPVTFVLESAPSGDPAP